MPRAKKNAKVAALNAITRSLHKNRRTIAKSNPELANFAGLAIPAVGAYVATRVAGNIATGMLAARAPRLAKHAKPLSSVALLALIWYAAKKSKTAAKYQNGLLAGAAVAAVQNLICTYIPALAGIFADNKLMLPTKYAPPAGTVVAPGELEAMAAEQELAAVEQELGDPAIPSMPMNGESDDFNTGVFAQN